MLSGVNKGRIVQLLDGIHIGDTPSKAVTLWKRGLERPDDHPRETARGIAGFFKLFGHLFAV